MATQSFDIMPVVWGAAIHSFISREIEIELPDKEIKLTGKDIEKWVARLTGALEQEWQKIKSELQSQ